MKTPEKWKIQFERLNTSKSPYFSLEDLIAHILLDGMKEGARRAAMCEVCVSPKRPNETSSGYQLRVRDEMQQEILTSAEQWTEKDLT